MMFAKDVRYQLLATVFCNIASLSYGTMCGWPSAALPILQDAKATPLETGPLSMEQASWVSSLMCAGGFFGNWFFAFCCERFGRKMPLIGCAVVMFAGWLLISLANSPDYLYAGRFLGGFSGGGIFVLVPMFVTEIAADHVRGALGSLLVFAGNLGFLVAFVLGNYLTYAMSPIVLLACPVLFVACFAFMPESPVYLVQCGRHADAAKALSFYRNACASESVVSMELDKLKAMFEKPKTANDSDASEATSIEWSFFCTPLARRAMLIGLGLVTLSQFNGCFAMMMYTATIFREAGTDIAPNMAAIVIGVIQVGGAYFSTVMVDRAGRKFLMVFSALGTACGLVSLGVHAHLKELGVDMSAWGWLPVASFSLAIFVASAGMLSLPFLIVAEIMPEKIRAIGTSICISMLWLFAFIIVKFFPIVTLLIGMHGSMYLFTVCCVIGTIFVIIMLPETKGKSFDEIAALLMKSNINS